MSNHIKKSSGDEKHSSLKSKKHHLLNKFLTKTFHMIEKCDDEMPSIASWNTDGLSFVIRDVNAFSETVLPMYYKHSKFASFVRQLNFYSFRKIRSPEPDMGGAKNTVVFAHDHFQRGRPELLHNITRITKSQEPNKDEIVSLRDEIKSLHTEISNLSTRFDQQVQAVTAAVEADYQQRMKNIALSYQALSTLSATMVSPSISPIPNETMSKALHISAPGAATESADKSSVSLDGSSSSIGNGNHTLSIPSYATVRSSNGDGSITSVATSSPGAESPTPAMSTLSPLLTLSGVATAMMEQLS
mmetsp:Transcript_10809/g.19915  ORF Transcript_10809/g.19915 Transcript_10809/m.19915 type:complete len:302 (+) Transcript_10809:351-1256(+)